MPFLGRLAELLAREPARGAAVLRPSAVQHVLFVLVWLVAVVAWPVLNG